LIQIALFKLTSSFSSGAWLCVGIKVDGESDILSKNVIKRDTAGECRPAGYSRTKPEANDNNKKQMLNETLPKGSSVNKIPTEGVN